jgi:hypothetical protein
MNQVFIALGSPDFIRGVALLLLTGVLTGFLVPQIVAHLAERRHRKQKLFEAELIRQRDVLAAQSDLLSSLSKAVWRFQLLNINVSFCRLNASQGNYERARDRYQSESADLLGQLRAELSSARRLVAQPTYEKLRRLYFDTLLMVDANLESLIRDSSESTPEEWEHLWKEQWIKQHRTAFEDAQTEIEGVLGDLARELRLSAPGATSDA